MTRASTGFVFAGGGSLGAVQVGMLVSDEARNPQKEGRFYAHWNRNNPAVEGQPHIFLHAEGKGHYVGTALQAQGLQPGMTYFFEGDDSTVVDGTLRMHGTGSEDYFNGGWYALPDRWDAALAVNLSAAFHAIRLSLPGMRARNYGRIFNMTSVYGSRGTVDRVDYITTKSALLGLTRSVALENLEFDVTCHSICPGSVLTPNIEGRVVRLMEERDLSREAAEAVFLKGKQPGGRFVSARSVTE